MQVIIDKLFLLLLIVVALIFPSCGPTTDEDGGPITPPSEGSYFIPYIEDIPSTNSKIETQYPIYNFVDGEIRNIYVYGLDRDYISVINAYEENSIKGQTFFDKFFVNEQNKEQFTAPIEISTYGIYDNTNITVKAMNGETIYATTSFQLNLYNLRKYEITHYCKVQQETTVYGILQNEFNVPSENPINVKTTIENIFEEAGTELIWPGIGNTIDVVYDAFITLTSSYGQELYNWVTQEADIYLNNPNDILLVGWGSYVNYIGEEILGVTIPYPNGGRACFVFQTKTYAATGSQASSLDKIEAKIMVISHELGHARGKNLVTDENNPYGYHKYLTDNETHTFGHNGNHKNFCIMYGFLGGEQIHNPHFCEGHQQMLLNIN